MAKGVSIHIVAEDKLSEPVRGAFNDILLWQLNLRYSQLVVDDILTEKEAVQQATFEYLERREMCLVPEAA